MKTEKQHDFDAAAPVAPWRTICKRERCMHADRMSLAARFRSHQLAASADQWRPSCLVQAAGHHGLLSASARLRDQEDGPQAQSADDLGPLHGAALALRPGLCEFLFPCMQFVHRFKDAIPDPVLKPIPAVLRAERKKKKAAKSAVRIQKLLEKCARVCRFIASPDI
jgi:hypothetical protein